MAKLLAQFYGKNACTLKSYTTQVYWKHQNKYKEQNENARNKMSDPKGIAQNGKTRPMQYHKNIHVTVI